MATQKTPEQIEAEKQAKAAKAAEAAAAKAAADKLTYLRSPQYAGLTIVKADGTSVRFVPYYDMFKGDKVKVGFLATDDAEVIERCESLGGIEVIDVKEFTEATETLEKAPVYSV